MRHTREKTGHYFQTVARFFLKQRGAPFFLSSQEIEIIASWEKTGIPVKAVLQGIWDSFESRKKRPGRKEKALSLAFCQPFVQRAFESHKERRIGGSRKPVRKEDKHKELRRNISLFLKSCPEGIPEIKEVYSKVYRLFSQGIDEQMLEALEKKIETLLIQKASEEEKIRIRGEVLQEFRNSDEKEIHRVADLKIAKCIREKYKIPHLSLYYY